MRSLNLKPFIVLILTLAWSIAQADPTFTFSHVGGGETGSLTKLSEGNYTFVGGGNDIWDVSDEFDFAHVTITGDFDIAVRIESIEPVARWSKAGVMARETLAGDSRKAWTRVTPPDVPTGSGGNGANDTRFAYRTGIPGAGGNGGQHEDGSGSPQFPNGWVRLERIGNVMNSYRSTDGANWSLLGSQDTATWSGNTPLANDLFVGLAVSRHSGPDPLCTTEFRDLQQPAIRSQPQNVTVPELSSATFRVGLAGVANYNVQWRENGVNIPGANGRSYTVASATAAHNGKRYSAVATDTLSGATLTSSEATLTVISDTFPPTLVSAATPISPTPIGTELNLVYSEPVNEADAENLANYTISGGATLNSAELQADNKTVRFGTSDLYGPGCKILTVNNVRDRSPTPNAIAANSTIAVITAKGNIRYHQFNGIGGTAVANLTSHPKFPNFPDIVAYKTFIEGPDHDGGDNFNDYGAQLVGFVHPPVSGDYIFHLAADDGAVLYLSTDDTPANKVAIATEPQWAGFREWTGNAGGRRTCNLPPNNRCPNVSLPITLQAGCKYYVEFIFKEGGGGDYGSVTWRLPGQPAPGNSTAPILTGAYLSPYDVPATISGGPDDVTIEEGRIITLRANIQGSPSLTIQWYRNGVAIEGANGPSITLGPLVYPDDNGAQYHVTAANSLGSATSRTATLTVLDDVTRPTIVSSGASSTFNQVQVQFSERMNAADIIDNFAYEITDPSGTALAINSISANADNTAVLITVEGTLAENTLYTIKVVGVVRDFSGNEVAPDTSSTFRSFISGCGGILFEAYNTGGGNQVSLLTGHPTFPDNPMFSALIGPVDSRAAYPDDSHEGYGARMRGVFVPPYSGNWVLYLRSDDAAELWFNSSGPSAAGKAKVAEELGCCRAFEAIPTAPMALTGGNPYYIEVLYKEGVGGDYGQVAARVAGSSEALAPIPARDTGAFALAGAGGTLSITQQPANTTADEGQPVTFSVRTENTHNLPVCYQWRKDGVDIPGATGANYTFRPALSDSGAVYSVRAGIPGMTVLSDNATLTVRPDTTRPTVTSVSGTDSLRNAIVNFSERINVDDGADEFLYTITDPSGGALGISLAELRPDGQSVLLTTDAQTPGTVYTVTVGEVRDRSEAQNTVQPPNNTGSFTAFTLSRGFLVFEAWNNIGGTAVSALTSDPRYPNNPDEVRYISTFDTIAALGSSDYRNNYGARVRGVFIPPTSGNWIFYLRSDDASELWLNPTGPGPDGKIKIQEELGCCGPFSAHASAPQALTAGQAYWIEGIYKEGAGGDYIQVAAKLDTDPTAANSLRPIGGSSIGTYADGVGVSLRITQQPPAEQTVCLNPLSATQPPATFSVAAQASRGSGGTVLASEDFNSDNGGFTVSTDVNFSGPWVYTAGNWHADGQDAELGAAMTSRLNSPTYTVTRAGVLQLTFKHRWSFEPGWDGGQVLVSINGGAHTLVPTTAFISGGYNGVVLGNSASAAKGQDAFINNSSGHATGNLITSVADLGSVNAGDTVSIQFLYAGDTNTRGSVPNWEIDSLTLTEGGGAGLPLAIQWQRNNGSGWVDIPGATGPTYSFQARTSDSGARFRAMAFTLGASATSSESALTVIQANTAPSFNLSASTVTSTEDSGASTVAGLATDIKTHSIPRTPVRLRTDFATAAGIALRGQAAVADGVLKLINAGVGGSYGAASGDLPLATYESLDVTWKNRIGGGNGADGMSLSIGSDIPVDPGYGGEEGVGTGLIVSIDTFDNGAALDPCQTGLELKWRGDILICKSIPKDNDGTGNYLRKDTFVDAHVTVTPAGVATFTYDGNEISATLPGYSGLTANRALFWARTGGAHDNHWVDDFDLQAFPFDSSSAEAGQTVSFQASNNNPSLFSAQPAISSDGTLTFTGAANACGQATVTVVASDSGGTACNGSDTSTAKTFVIDIGCSPDRPVANDQSKTTYTAVPTPITLTGTDPDGPTTLTFAKASDPSHGTVVVNSDGSAVYTSNPGFSGLDSFTFTVTDAEGNTSSPGTVSIEVIFNTTPNCVAAISPAGCSLSIGSDPSKKYVVAANGQSACVILDASGSTDADGDSLQMTWVIDGTNTVSGAQVPACLDVGCHSVDLIVTDGKTACRESFDLCVITAADGIDQIIALVEDADLGRKNKRPLIATLKAAAASYEREGHNHTAANQLNAFQNKVRAQLGREHPAEAQQLIDAAAGLVEAIACSEELAAEE